jgi:hypothetical protein
MRLLDHCWNGELTGDGCHMHRHDHLKTVYMSGWVQVLPDSSCLFFFESTPKAYHIFIEGRGLSTRTAPLATSNERNPTQHRLQTKQPQHEEPVLSKKPSHVSTDAKHLRRGTAPKGSSLSTHHPKEINGGTYRILEVVLQNMLAVACIAP